MDRHRTQTNKKKLKHFRLCFHMDHNEQQLQVNPYEGLNRLISNMTSQRTHHAFGGDKGKSYISHRSTALGLTSCSSFILMTLTTNGFL